MGESISLKELFYVLKKRLVLIFLIALSALILSSIYTFFVATPQYEASTQILVNQTQNNEQPITTNELQSNREIINTYNVIITSPSILEIVLEETGLNRSIGELQSQINVSAEGESQVVTLSVTDPSPQNANLLSNTIARVFEQEITNIMNIDNVSILAESQLSDISNPISPTPILNMIIALFLGGVLGIVLAFLKEFLDQTVKTEQDVENILNIPILGSISVIDKEMDEVGVNNSKKQKSTNQSRKTS